MSKSLQGSKLQVMYLPDSVGSRSPGRVVAEIEVVGYPMPKFVEDRKPIPGIRPLVVGVNGVVDEDVIIANIVAGLNRILGQGYNSVLKVELS